MIIHVVRPGDSIFLIARQYGVSPQSIIADNELTQPDRLVVGQTIVVKEGAVRHTVLPGQSLFIIAGIYGVTVNAIVNANPEITDPALIFPGQILIIPDVIGRLGTIEVNGYAFTNIVRNVLNKTLPHLTYLSIFSHEVTAEGTLRDINDRPLILEAYRAGVAPLMVVTNLLPGAGFSSDLARAVLTNPVIRNRLIENIAIKLNERNYYGLDIDFEYVYPEDREAYNTFLRLVVERLRPIGYQITTALAPKISADQPGLLYEAHDYPVHGRLTDHVILMTYEWGYTFGPPLPVAPINQVRRVLDYAVTAIPRDKILMGIPNYGYDWTLPYVPGTAARSLSNVAAVQQAIEVQTAIQYDMTAQSPFYNYYDVQGRQHIVWFEDARSIQAKLLTVNQYGLAGVSYWTIMRYFPQNWLVLESLYNVYKVFS